jgi:hypothetical protein
MHPSGSCLSPLQQTVSALMHAAAPRLTPLYFPCATESLALARATGARYLQRDTGKAEAWKRLRQADWLSSYGSTVRRAERFRSPVNG